MTRRRPSRSFDAILLALVLMLVLALLGACGGGSDGDGDGDAAADGATATTDGGDDDDGATVVLEDIVFKPKKVTIEVGETVLWLFEDKGIKHNVVAEDKSFKSATKDTGTYRRTFRAPGSYRYVCTLHPDMTGTVVVTEGGAGASTTSTTTSETSTTTATTAPVTGY